MNEMTLEDLTKEDLIKAFANVSDGVSWHDGHGFAYREADLLNKIAALCLDYCSKNNDWTIKINE